MNTKQQTKENLKCATCGKTISSLVVGFSFGKYGINHSDCLEIKLTGSLKKKRKYRV